MKFNYHKEAIKVLRNVHTEHEMRELLMKIAEHRPSAILRAAGINSSNRGWSKGAVSEKLEAAQWLLVDAHIVRHEQIRGIKQLRANTGVGLKEAKEACEVRRDYLVSINAMEHSQQ